jgi:S-adenosylmethionine:tRNA ribosyltransferase-isomerase
MSFVSAAKAGSAFSISSTQRLKPKGRAAKSRLRLRFTARLDRALAERGDVPLPPYIAGRRAADEQDRGDYQTIFAREEGASPAPTAGLHFTERSCKRCRARRWLLHKVTLHVGAGLSCR